jgi:hypothetical protein
MSSKKAGLSPNSLDETAKNRHFPSLMTLEAAKREDPGDLRTKNLHFESKDVKKIFVFDKGRQL